MKEQKRNSIVALSFILLVSAILLFVAPKTFATPQDNTMGFSWAGNIGWLSANNCTNILDQSTCTGGTYGVNVLKEAPGTISGYAWSSNIGWISFNSSAFSGSSITRDDGTTVSLKQAAVDWSTKKVSGFARACSVFASGCSGALKLDAYTGKWDGYIALSDTKSGDSATWGVSISPDGKKMSGYAWGSDVVGWIDMSFDIGEPAVPQCRDGIDNDGDGKVDHSSVTPVGKTPDGGCYDPDDDDETDIPSPEIMYFLSQCIATPTAKPSFAWDTDKANECRILSQGQTDYPGTCIKYAEDGTTCIGNSSYSSKESGGILDALGHYFKQSKISANGAGTQYTLECIGNGGTITEIASVALCTDGGGDGGTPDCRDGIDNDGDGKIDFSTSTQGTPGPTDPGCSSGDDDNEKDLKPVYEEH